MLNIELVNKVGLILFIVGIVSLFSGHAAPGSEWLSVLFFSVGAFLYLFPDKFDKE